jgi:hypothetical protein
MTSTEKDAAAQGPAAEIRYGDEAATFLYYRDSTVDSSSVDIVPLRRKIDVHIVPLIFCCYMLQFLDKVILNVSLCGVGRAGLTWCSMPP